MTVHIVGAGLAGLACAIALQDAGHAISLIEAAPFAGGRCRSYHDRELGCRIDNGNHLLLSGNDAAYAYLHRLGTADTLGGPATPLFPFHDLATGESWTLRLSQGRIPTWVLHPGRRVPGTRLAEYLSLSRWLHVPPDTTVAQIARPGPLYRRLIEPLAISALNTMPDHADATLMAAVLRGTLLRGGAACVPAYPAIGLSESFIDPALALLARQGAPIRLNRRVNALQIAQGRVITIGTGDGPIDLAPHDSVVLAVPAPVAATLLPGLNVPDAFEAILNIHYRIDLAPGAAGFTGLIGGLAEWVFFKPGITSVTVSAANRHADLPAEEVATRVWTELRQLRDLPETMPPHRVVREKRATFAATPAQNRRRPVTATALSNLDLAGDWTATGLPATIEGAIRSGQAAARHRLGRHMGAMQHKTLT